MNRFKGKNILITGASGFLGTYLAEACFAEDAVLYGIDIFSPLKKNIWKNFSTEGIISSGAEDIFKQNSFDIIFHLAGAASVYDSVQFPEKDFNSIIPPTLKLLQLMHAYCNNAHLILFSSAAVYGNPDSLPVKETAAVHPLSPYGIHKAMAEDLVKYYSSYFGFKASVLRIFSAFGEGLRKQIFWDVMCRYKKLLDENIKENITLNLFGTGYESRDFIHAEDAANAAVLIAASKHNNSSFQVFNVAGGKEADIKNAVEYLFDKAEVKPMITFTGTAREGDPERWQADISKIKQYGFEAKRELKDCLGEYYKWFMSINNI